MDKSTRQQGRTPTTTDTHRSAFNPKTLKSKSQSEKIQKSYSSARDDIPKNKLSSILQTPKSSNPSTSNALISKHMSTPEKRANKSNQSIDSTPNSKDSFKYKTEIASELNKYLSGQFDTADSSDLSESSDHLDPIGELQTQNELLKKSIKEKDNELFKLNQKLRKAVRHVKAHKIRKELAEQEVESNKDEFNNLQENLKEKDKLISQLYEEAKSINATSVDAHNELKKVTALYKTMEKNFGGQLKATQDKLKSAQHEYDSNLRSMKKKFVSLQSENDSLRIAVTEYQAMRNSLQEDKEEFMRKNNSHKKEIEKNMKFSESESFDEIEGLREQNTYLVTKTQELTEENEKFKLQLKRIKSTKNSSIQKGESTSLSEVIREKDAKIKNLQNEINSLLKSSTVSFQQRSKTFSNEFNFNFNKNDDDDDDNYNFDKENSNNAVFRSPCSQKSIGSGNSANVQTKSDEEKNRKLTEQMNSFKNVSSKDESLAGQLSLNQNEKLASQMKSRSSSSTFDSDTLLHEIKILQEENKELRRDNTELLEISQIMITGIDDNDLNSQTQDSFVKNFLLLKQQNENLKKEIDQIYTHSMISNVDNSFVALLNENKELKSRLQSYESALPSTFDDDSILRDMKKQNTKFKSNKNSDHNSSSAKSSDDGQSNSHSNKKNDGNNISHQYDNDESIMSMMSIIKENDELKNMVAHLNDKVDSSRSFLDEVELLKKENEKLREENEHLLQIVENESIEDNSNTDKNKSLSLSNNSQRKRTTQQSSSNNLIEIEIEEDKNNSSNKAEIEEEEKEEEEEEEEEEEKEEEEENNNSDEDLLASESGLFPINKNSNISQKKSKDSDVQNQREKVSLEEDALEEDNLEEDSLEEDGKDEEIIEEGIEEEGIEEEGIEEEGIDQEEEEESNDKAEGNSSNSIKKRNPLSDGEVISSNDDNDANTQYSDLKAKYLDICNENEELKEQNESMQEEMNELQNHFNSLFSMQLHSTLAELDDVRQGHQELKQRSFNLELLQKENTFLKHRVLNLETQKIELQHCIDMQGNIDSKSQLINSLLEENDILKKEIQVQQKNLSISINSMANDSDDGNNDNSDSQKDNNNSSMLKEKTEQMRSVLKTINKTSDSSNDDDNNSSSSSSGNELKDVRSLKRENQKLKDIIEKLEPNGVKGNSKTQLLERIKELELSVSDTQSQIQELENANYSLNQKMESYSQKEKKLVKQYEEEKQNLRNQIKSLQNLLNNNEFTESEISNILAKFKSQISGLQNSLKELQQESSKINDKMRSPNKNLGSKEIGKDIIFENQVQQIKSIIEIVESFKETIELMQEKINTTINSFKKSGYDLKNEKELLKKGNKHPTDQIEGYNELALIPLENNFNYIVFGSDDQEGGSDDQEGIF